VKVLIVEDEPLIARRVERFCREILGPALEHVRLAGTFEQASALLSEAPIDLLLLDLNLSGRDGMELLQASVAGSFHTVIVSANTDHALRAFEFGVLDFVAKPFSKERLAQALQRVTDATQRGPSATRFLAVKKHGRIELVRVDEILFVQGADDYSEVVLADGRRELHDKTLERLEAVLPPEFERIHKSYLVRLSAVKTLHTHEGSQYEAELQNGMRLPVGRTRYKDLRARLL
jgi:two-component system, LytTR family, response regulator LytT